MEYNPNREELNPLIEALEEKRQRLLELRKAAKYLYWIPLGLFVVFVLMYLVYTIPLGWCFMFCICLGLFIKFRKVDAYQEEYNKIYKETFVQAFVPIFYPKMTYLPGKFSTSNNIQASFLYDKLGFEQKLSCEDGFRGKTAQGLGFSMMEVFYELEKGRTVEVKREFFVSIELPNKGYRPLIVAKKAIMEPILEGYNSKEINESILEQTGFESYFGTEYGIYSQEKEDAKILLTKDFLSLIQRLKKQWTEDIRFSFVDDNLHIAISTQNNFFEANLEKAVLVEKTGQELFNQLAIYLSTVEELSIGLNQIQLPSPERIPLPENLKLPNQNWDDSAYDHFIDN